MFELELIFNDNEVMYITSNTKHLNDEDLEFLNELNVEITEIKEINIEEL